MIHSLVLETLKGPNNSIGKGVRDPVLFCCVGNKVIAHVALGSRCIYVHSPFACLIVVVYFSLVMMLGDGRGKNV